MTPSRAYGLALGGLLVGAALVVWAYAQVWGTVQVPVPGSEATQTWDVLGQAVWPVGSVSGWLAAASAIGIVATRGWGRTAVAIIAIVAGLAAAFGGVRFATGSAAALNEHALASLGASGVGASATSAWWTLACVGGLLIVAAGAWSAARGRTWPAMGARYERTPRRLSAWEAQDLGQDPTDDLVE